MTSKASVSASIKTSTTAASHHTSSSANTVSRINIVTSPLPLKIDREMPAKLKLYLLASEWTHFCDEIDTSLKPLNIAFRNLKRYVFTALGLSTFIFLMYMIFSVALTVIPESYFIFVAVPLMALLIFSKFIIVVYIGYKIKEANKAMQFVCNVMSAKKQAANLHFHLKEERPPILVAGCCRKDKKGGFVKKVFNSHIEVNVGSHPIFGDDLESLKPKSSGHHTVPTCNSSIPEVMSSSTDGILQDLEKNIERDQSWCQMNLKPEKVSRWR